MNCKPGDMAVVTKAARPENVGLIVEVLQLADPQDHPSGLWAWRIKPAWPIRASDGRLVGRLDIPYHPDAWLRPIRPPETPVTETRDEELTA